MFLSMFLMFFYKSEKNMFFVFFYLQINVFNIYGSDCDELTGTQFTCFRQRL